MNRMYRMYRMYRTLLAAVTLAVSSVTASAETITVCASGCDYTSINAAINAASDGEVIQLAAETYFEGQVIDTLGKAITLRGVLDKAGEPASVLDGAGAHRVLICESGEGTGTIFERLVIRNGLASGYYPNGRGGGMRNNASSPTLTNCTFTSNLADYGGGMYNSSSSPTLTNCTFTGNLADYGGGMYNSSSSPTLTNCNFCGNVDGSGFNSISGDAINGSSSGNNLLDAACVFGDINFDGVANLADRTPFNTLIGVCDADINGDGEVNGADMAFILSWWGPCIP